MRPIRPEDAEIEREFVHALSPQARYLRFMSAVKELTPAMLARFTQIDYDREMALIAVAAEGGRERQVGVGRYVANAEAQSCEFAIVVADDWHGSGLGRHLMQRLITLARDRGLVRMEGEILASNAGMIRLAVSLGFEIRDVPGAPMLRHAELRLA